MSAGASIMSSMPRATVERPQEVTTELGTPPKTGWAKLVPELLVSDIGASIEFWCDRLGFAIAYQRPEEAFAYYFHEGVHKVVCEQKHMGSRAVVVVCRDAETSRTRFGIL